MRDIEEQPFEANLDGVVEPNSGVDQDGFPVDDCPKIGTTTASQSRATAVGRLSRDLTNVSVCYDRNNKGFLDPTERAVRNMDNKNRGLIEPEYVLQIMESLQEEQKRSSELIDTIRTEHKRATSLRRLVVGLTLFVVLLAIANIGVSFTAAQLAKDMHVTHHDLVSLDGERLGTTNKLVQVAMEPLNGEEKRHRNLALATEMACGKDPFSNGQRCALQGLIRYPDAVKMHQQFCRDFPNNNNNICGQLGVGQISLNCGGAISTVFGGNFLPKNKGPTMDKQDWGYTVFPAVEEWYHASTVHTQPGMRPCVQPYQLTMWCMTDGSPCAVFGTFNTTICPGAAPAICGTAGGPQQGV